jgi:membrane protein implicated in regulation of membrane protease activity
VTSLLGPLRLVLALAGFALAVLSVALDSHTLGWVAIAVLSISLLLRLVSQRQTREDEADKGL